jgi:hypothetical protein
VSGQQHAPAALYRRERPGNHFTGGWVVPRAGLDGRKISIIIIIILIIIIIIIITRVLSADKF